MQHDLVVAGGTVVDGTGSPPLVSDVAITDGRIVAVEPPGRLAGTARRRVDADGLFVAPGFIDVHTHHDAQVFWDPACTPSPLHGVTTVIAGNCGFSLAPLPAQEADYLMRMMSRVEGIPLAALQSGVPWDWSTTAEYLGCVAKAGPVVNMGFLAGHSALRRAVMGAAASGEPASPGQLAAMRTLLDESLRAGALGFSSSYGDNHLDADGDPVPSRYATAEELEALAAVVADHPAPQIEFIPPDAFDETDVEIMVRLSLAARRPLNWNILIVRRQALDEARRQLAASDTAAVRGASIKALSYPGPLSLRLSFRGPTFQRIPGWRKPMSCSTEQRLALLADPVRRAELAALVPPDDQLSRYLVWTNLEVIDTFSPATSRYRGRAIAEIAASEGRDPFDVICDIAVADGLRTIFAPVPDEDDASWAMRISTWSDWRVVLGASDAGAHVDTVCSFDFATAFLALNRLRGALPLEAAVHQLTGVPAGQYGLQGRGRIAVGCRADLVIFDPDVVAPGPVEWRNDLPRGAGRLYGEAVGLSAVLVGGVEVVVDGALTGAQPGTVLRSGADALPPSRNSLPRARGD
jgi:N-acyl-D-aspartate/D-glutamate deacylase